MPSANEKLNERATRHQVYLLRYSGSVRNKLIGHLNRVEDDLLAQIRKRADAGTFTEWRLNKILEDVRDILRDAQSDSYGIVRDDLLSFVSYEAEHAEEGLRSALQVDFNITRPAPAQLRAAVLSRPFQGRILREWVTELTDAQRRNVRNAIRIGFTEGESIDAIVRRIRGTRAQQFRDGIFETTRRQAEALVRTAVGHSSNYARQALFEENGDILKGWQFVATIDGRTTLQCASLDGNVYEIGKGPQPPRHVNCRSTSVPVLRDAEEIFGRNVGKLPEGTRASIDGAIPASTTYGKWLRNQPKSVQDEVLGPTKAKLFRDGGMDVSRFVEERTGRVYSLDELRRKDAEAFAAAGF